MMKQYETLLLLDASVNDETLQSLEKQMTTTLKAAKGALAKFDKWGRYRLAYPIRKQDYGVYVLARYEVEDTQSFFAKIDTHLKVKCVDFVMRHVHVKLEPSQLKAEYIRPESIEEVGEPTDRRDGRGRGPRRDMRGEGRSQRDAAPVKAAEQPAQQDQAAPAKEEAEAKNVEEKAEE